MTSEMWHVTPDMWHMTPICGGGEPSLKISASYLVLVLSYCLLNIFTKDDPVNELMNKLMNKEGVCRTAPATPGLLNIWNIVLGVNKNLFWGFQ